MGVLKILHVVSGDLWAGAEAQMYALVSSLARMPDTEVAAVLMNDGELGERLRSIGTTVFITDEHKFGPLRIFASLRKLIGHWRPDVVHTHREKENVLGTLANFSSVNVASVRTVHGGAEYRGAGWTGIRRRIIEVVDLWCARVLQQRIIVVSAELATRIADKFPVEKLVVIENGVDAEALTKRKDAAEFRVREPHCVHVGVVGRLVDVKRIDLFLEAAALLQRDWPQFNWRFHVFGDGPLRVQLERLSHRLGIANVATFYGHRKDIAACIASLDTIVICSDHEGMPMTALEAAALGVPTVAHAVGGLVDLLPREFLVTQHDATGYMEGVLNATRGDGRIVAKRRAAEVSAKYSAQNNAERIRSIYEQVVAEKRTR